ncbi:MAG TPA: DUF4188 domain-containing protein [Rhizomicrobium sp.]|jgi:hypothetical protein|nr:DUF4188 domain-containing protein [Rhizomicrobium sp.]
MEHSTSVVPGRMTAKLDKPVVLFLIGMRLNRLSTFPKWLWFMRTMPAMLAELEKTPDSGLLWYRQYISFPVIMVQQYWESFEKLEAYSHDPARSHHPAWARYMRELLKEGSIGIWHETYRVEPGMFECVYGNMPRFGLAAASTMVKAEGHMMGARDRMGA